MLRRVAWLVAIWAASVAVVGVAALSMRLLMGMAGLVAPSHANDPTSTIPRHAGIARPPRLVLGHTKAWMAGLRPP
nr:DUF2474 family protein [uncultured Rhodopila sp.]